LIVVDLSKGKHTGCGLGNQPLRKVEDIYVEKREDVRRELMRMRCSPNNLSKKLLFDQSSQGAVTNQLEREGSFNR